jgi:hypothetical protein
VEPVCKQRIVKVMVDRPSDHMPDTAQQLIDTFFFGWTCFLIVSLMGEGVDSDLKDGSTKENIIRSIGKEDVVIVIR